MTKLVTVLVLVLALFVSSVQPVEAKGSGKLLLGAALGYMMAQSQNQGYATQSYDQGYGQQGNQPYCYTHGGYHDAGVWTAQCQAGQQQAQPVQYAQPMQVAQSYYQQPAYAQAQLVPVQGGFVAAPTMINGAPFYAHGYIPGGCAPVAQPVCGMSYGRPFYGNRGYYGHRSPYNSRRW